MREEIKEEIKYASIYDDALEQQGAHIWRLSIISVAANDPQATESRETVAEMLERAFKQNAAFLTGRAQDEELQAQIIKDRFNDPVFNAGHWRQSAWIDRQAELKRAEDDKILHLVHKDGGKIDVAPDFVRFDEKAEVNRSAIETSILHIKATWGGEPVFFEGNETFKATSWAYAQFHGVEVENYIPAGDSAKLAVKIIAELQSQEANRPKNKPFLHDDRLAA